MRQQGTVRWFSGQGFGFIDALPPVDGSAIYFHITSVKNRAILKTGDRVTFDAIPSPKGGLKAINVVRVSDTREENQCPHPATA